MKKIFLSFGVIVAFALFATFTRKNVSTGLDSLLTSTNNPAPTVVLPNIRFFGDDSEEFDDDGRVMTRPPTIPAPTTTVNPSTGGTMMDSGGMMSKYRDGTYPGNSVYAYTDYIQVNAVISGGKLADVTYSSQTGGPGRSQMIYDYAMPQLKSEAISTQSANVNAISGASYTSQAFKESLAAALTNALK
ncbi:MAG: FMN-binding protein [Minisyncoccia bacterium]